jgi:hypothetical protein
MSAINTYPKTRSISAPIEHAFAISPDNSNELSFSTRGIYVGVSGDLKVDLIGSGTVTFVGLAAGVIHPLRVKKVYATGTTATSIVGVN